MGYNETQLARIDNRQCVDCGVELETDARRCAGCAERVNKAERKRYRNRDQRRRNARLIKSKRLSYTTIKAREAANGERAN